MLACALPPTIAQKMQSAAPFRPDPSRSGEASSIVSCYLSVVPMAFRLEMGIQVKSRPKVDKSADSPQATRASPLRGFSPSTSRLLDRSTSRLVLLLPRRALRRGGVGRDPALGQASVRAE